MANAQIKEVLATMMSVSNVKDLRNNFSSDEESSSSSEEEVDQIRES